MERPSHRLKLLDEAVAYDFDMACQMAIFYHEQRAEEIRLEAMSGGAFRRAANESSFFTQEADEYLRQGSQRLGDI